MPPNGNCPFPDLEKSNALAGVLVLGMASLFSGPV